MCRVFGLMKCDFMTCGTGAHVSVRFGQQTVDSRHTAGVGVSIVRNNENTHRTGCGCILNRVADRHDDFGGFVRLVYSFDRLCPMT